MKVKKMAILFMTGIFLLVSCGAALASQPQYAENVVLKMKGGVNGNIIPENTPVYILDDCGDPETPGDWTLTYRATLGKKEYIAKVYNLDPWGAAECVRGITSNDPYRMELLSVNGVPWQIFDAPDKVPVEVVGLTHNLLMKGHGLTFEEADQMIAEAKKTMGKVSYQIEYMMTDPLIPWSKFRQTLPEPGKKMISIYKDSTAVALYTHNTVEAKHLVARPQIINGSLMVPLTGVVDFLGADITWDGTTRTVTIKNAGKEIKFRPGENVVEVNGQKKALDTPPTIINGRTMIPVRFISEELGYTVKWWGDIDPRVPRVDIYN